MSELGAAAWPFSSEKSLVEFEDGQVYPRVQGDSRSESNDGNSPQEGGNGKHAKQRDHMGYEDHPRGYPGSFGGALPVLSILAFSLAADCVHPMRCIFCHSVLYQTQNHPAEIRCGHRISADFAADGFLFSDWLWNDAYGLSKP